MDQLDLLCELDKHYNLLLDYEDEKNNLGDKYASKLNDGTAIKLEENLNIIKKNIEALKEKLDETERSFKQYNYTVKEMEERLYSGNIKDIKQLETLSEEKENLKEIIGNTETKILQYMEKIETYENKFKEIKNQLEYILNQNNVNKLNYEKIDKSLFANINKTKKDIEKAKSHVDENLLKKYEKIRKNKRSALAEMKDGVCLGCNMTISTNMVEKIKASKDIICCENCGRILCKPSSLRD